jgi:hypothetical protein
MEVKYHMNPAEGFLPGGQHAVVQGIRGVEQAGQIMEDELGIGGCENSDYRQAGCLSLGAHDGQMGAYQAIEERGFSRVGGAGKGDVT